MKAVYSTTKYFSSYNDVLNYLEQVELDARYLDIKLVVDIYIKEEVSKYNFWSTNFSLVYKVVIKAYDYKK